MTKQIPNLRKMPGSELRRRLLLKEQVAHLTNRGPAEFDSMHKLLIREALRRKNG